MGFDQLRGWAYLAAWVVEELLEVLDGKVTDTNVLDTATGWQLLQLLPCLDEVPVGEMLLEVIRVGGGGPVHEVEVNIVGAERLKGAGNAVLDTVVPRVVELRFR